MLIEKSLSLTLSEGQNLNLNCAADGIPRPSIQWIKDGEFIDSTRKRLQIFNNTQQGFRTDIIGHWGREWGTNSTLTITSLTVTDTGRYFCRATNGAQQVPSILNQPFHITVTRGYTFNISLAVKLFNLLFFHFY